MHKEKVIYDCIFNDNRDGGRNDLLTSLIIGENGVGKSYLLSVISEFFRLIEQKKKVKNKSFKYEVVEVNYTLDGNEYSIYKNKDSIHYKKNGKNVELNNILLPNKILALSFMVNDKFSFSSNVDNFYNYLGVRATSNATYTSSIQKKLLSSLLKLLKDNSRVESLKKVFNFLEINNKVNVQYKLKRKTLFTRGITPKQIENKIKSLEKRKIYISGNVNRNIIESSVILADFISSIYVFYDKDTSSVNIPFDLNKSKHYSYDSFTLLDMLEKLEFLAPPEVEFFKGELFSFEHTSSGEKHFIYTMVNLISHIEKHSLIFIDEPELSLHPRWQMKYIRLLKSITEQYKCSHCILASHSHFMVSDLDPKSSTLISLKTSETEGSIERISNLIKYETHAWSAENILYTVFGLRTSRNYYFEKDLSDLLSLISTKSNEINKIIKLYRKLKHYSLDPNDPLNILLSECERYMESKNDK